MNRIELHHLQALQQAPATRQLPADAAVGGTELPQLLQRGIRSRQRATDTAAGHVQRLQEAQSSQCSRQAAGKARVAAEI